MKKTCYYVARGRMIESHTDSFQSVFLCENRCSVLERLLEGGGPPWTCRSYVVSRVGLCNIWAYEINVR